MYNTASATLGGESDRKESRPRDTPGGQHEEGAGWQPTFTRQGGRLPDFIIAGAPRSGTTWLYRALEKHPQIAMARPLSPEPKFFLVDDRYSRGLDYYALSWFRDLPQDRLAGEKSTNYLESGTAAERIAADLPGVRLVFILREPVERAYSNYLWSRRNGLETESFPEALEREQAREANLPDALRFARPHAYFSRGLYAQLLEPFFRLFGREQILCLRFEDICDRPGALIERLQRYLGATPRPNDALGLGVVNESDPDAPAMPTESRERLRTLYREPNLQLTALLGEDFWPTTGRDGRR
jgi:hypothetical protein